MLSSQQTRQVQKLMVLIGVFLGLYYVIVYRPLSQRAAELDRPLTQVWQKLVEKKAAPGSAGTLDSDSIDARLRTAKLSLQKLKSTADEISETVALDAGTRSRMQEQFQLIDFQLEEQFRIEELGNAARENKVALAAPVFAGFPDYTAANTQPSLLWPQLTFLEQLLDTAIRCHVGAVQSAELPSWTWHFDPVSGKPSLCEIPLRVVLTGSMEAVSKFLLSLPARPAAVKSLNLPALSTNKPAMFIHRLILRKNSAEVPDEVQLDLRACGFVRAE